LAMRPLSGDTKREKLNSLMQNINKALIVVLGLEYGLPTPATVHYMVPGVLILYAKRPRHIEPLSKYVFCVKSRLDPFF
jgi:hypothetical protein